MGLTAGYSTFLGLDLEARRAVVVLTNTGRNNIDYVGFHLLDPTVSLAPAGKAGFVRSDRIKNDPALIAAIRDPKTFAGIGGLADGTVLDFSHPFPWAVRGCEPGPCSSRVHPNRKAS